MLDLSEFVAERESIRLKKEQGLPAPWTDNPILAKYRFCNVRRRDDRVSKWLLENCYAHLDTDGDPWFPAAVFRLINWPPTIAALLEKGVVPDDVASYLPTEFAAVLENYHQENKGKTYTGAYMLYAGGRGPFAGVVKSDFIAHHILGGLSANRFDIRKALKKNSVREAVNALKQSFGIHSFMAGQIVADLTYLPGVLDKATDLYTYAPQGPGSIRGLNRLYGKKLGHSWDQEDFNNALKRIHLQISANHAELNLTLHDVQNVMCEADKYWRTEQGEGKPRSEYRPETAY